MYAMKYFALVICAIALFSCTRKYDVKVTMQGPESLAENSTNYQ